MAKKTKPPITVYNCSDNDDLDLFRSTTLKIALSEIHEKWKIGSQQYRDILHGTMDLKV